MIPDALNQNGTYPRPQLVRDRWVDLGGPWEFAMGGGETDTPEEVTFDRTILVPFPPESPASGIGMTGFCPVTWYRRSITRAEIDSAGLSTDRSRLLVHFGAVDFTASVWIDRILVGTHEGGQTPFSVDATDAARRSSEPIELVVRSVDDPHDLEQPRGKQDWLEHQHAIWYGRTSGIWQPVWLEAVPQHRITAISWSTPVESAEVRLSVEFSERLAPGSALGVTLRLEGVELAHANWRVEGRRWEASIPVGALGHGQDRDRFLWSPERPTLVSAAIELISEHCPDQVGSYFGIRTVGVASDAFLLNGRPYFVRSVLEQGFWPDSHLAAPSTEALRDEVRLIKQLGFNAARVHQKAEDPRFLYWADREGLLIWGEIASAYAFSDRAVRMLMAEWTAIVLRDRSHPSVVTWVPLNESWGVQDISCVPAQQSYSLALASLTRALDPTRPVISNDGWEHTDSDIWTIHDYTNDPAVLSERYGSTHSARALLVGSGPERRPVRVAGVVDRGQPIMLTEFGGVSFDPVASTVSWGYSTAATAEDFAGQLQELIGAATRARGIVGFCYTQLTDTGLETNGLLYADRTPKVPMAVLRSIVAGTESEPVHK